MTISSLSYSIGASANSHCPSELAGKVCEAMVEFSLFLGCLGHLRGGRERGRSLARLANTLEGAMCAAIADQTNHATTKSPAAGVEGSARDLAEADLPLFRS